MGSDDIAECLLDFGRDALESLVICQSFTNPFLKSVSKQSAPIINVYSCKCESRLSGDIDEFSGGEEGC